MPEIKHTFQAGRMNKDLDERLLPNGEYRDAMNIEVSGSDGSNVGAVQNVRGNRKRSIVNIAGGKCIGSIADTENEKIYWFIAGNNIDAIAEYDQKANHTTPVLVDAGATDADKFLFLEKDKLITGINLVDGLLFFTDDNREPKVVNIERSKAGSTDFATSTQYETPQGASYNVGEDDITVIKKGPSAAPTLTMANTRRVTASGVTGIINTSGTANFYDSSNTEPMEVGENVTVTITGPLPTYQTGDILIFTQGNDPDINGYDPDFTVRCEVVSYSGGSTINVKIQGIPEIVPTSAVTWTIELEQQDAMFLDKFVRFAVRYKYRDGEYSTIGPFSEIAFLPKEFEYNPKKGYNLGMENDLRYLKISGFTTGVHKGVIEVDVLYKDESNTNIYTVKSFKHNDAEYSANEFELESELIYKTIPSNQLLRAFDSVPLKAKSQELVANRIVYGNYVQNFDMLTVTGDDVKPKFEVSVQPRSGFTQAVQYKSPGKSLKSQRTYQFGVVYRDEYGRETPVFTDTTASKNIPKNASKAFNQFKVKMLHDKPAFAKSFKFFIKETSNEYYNMAMDRWYDAEDDNIWLSFPSAERNKVTEESFLILKKKHDTDECVEAEAKYKVIAISNEAPLFLKQIKTSQGRASFGTTTAGLGASNFPAVDGSVFRVSKKDFIENSGFSDEPGGITGKSGLLVRFITASGKSDYYKISSIAFTDAGSGTDFFDITIDGKFGSDMSIVGTHGSPAAGLAFEIFQEEVKNKAEFSGRFFVKVYRDQYLNTAILTTTDEVSYRVAATAPIMRRDGSCSTSSSGHWKDDIFDNKFRWVFDRCRRSTHWGANHVHGNSQLWYENRSGVNKPPGVFANKDYISISILGTRDTYTGGYSQFNDFAQKIRAQGTKFRFRHDQFNSLTGEPEIYTITDSCVTLVTNYNGGSGHWESNQRTIFTLKLDKPVVGFSQTQYANRNTNQMATIEILEVDLGENTFSTNNPAIWETEPREAIDVDLYYEASNVIPIAQHGNDHVLDYTNCYSFGNGVESNRIRDDFNTPTIAKGVKASTVLAEQYKQERKKGGLIFSQIYNSLSGINRTNQFIIAEAITKDLNPEYGSIQKLHQRNTDLVVCCEDKILRVLANKDALFNADGSANVTSNKAVLGQAVPYVGEYGISTNPESFASYGFRAYFTDRARGVVLRLSRDGLTEISAAGMVDYFRDKLAVCDTMVGSYNDNKNSYCLTFTHLYTRGDEDTVCYKEQVKGWPSRQSYLKESGLSLNNMYYTFKNGEIYSHDSPQRNTFYGNNFTPSSLTLILNDFPGTIKSFKTLNYEGTRTRVVATKESGNVDESLYDFSDITGWYAPTITTDVQSGNVPIFIDKENKWFNYIKGDATTLSNLDTKEFSVQGIGRQKSIDGDTTTPQVVITITENNDENPGY